MAVAAASSSRCNIQTHEHTLLVREIADNFLQRRRQFPDEGWYGENLIGAGELRLNREINDFEIVASGEMGLANLFEICEGGDGPGCLAGDVETQVPAFPVQGRFNLESIGWTGH